MHRCDDSRFKKLVPPRDPSASPTHTLHTSRSLTALHAAPPPPHSSVSTLSSTGAATPPPPAHRFVDDASASRAGAPLGKAGRLVTHCLGGLNQQRFQVGQLPEAACIPGWRCPDWCAAASVQSRQPRVLWSWQVVESVLVAWLTNAILVDPLLGLHLAWNDDSKLSEIFDTSHLHAKLAHVVKFVDLEAALPVQGKLTPPTAARFEWWEEKVPLLLKRVHTMEITSMHRRLNTSYAAMPEPMRFLWCYVNFHALRFVAPIEQLAIRAVERMHGRFTAVHLRLEEDMLAKL
jgi:hypothetical protein